MAFLGAIISAAGPALDLRHNEDFVGKAATNVVV